MFLHAKQLLTYQASSADMQATAGAQGMVCYVTCRACRFSTQHVTCQLTCLGLLPPSLTGFTRKSEDRDWNQGVLTSGLLGRAFCPSSAEGLSSSNPSRSPCPSSVLTSCSNSGKGRCCSRRDVGSCSCRDSGPGLRHLLCLSRNA